MFCALRATSVAAGVVLSIAVEAAAEVDRDMATCATIANSVERLTCYDALALKRDVAAPKVDINLKGDWEVKTETSKIDDSTNVMMRLESENSFQDRMAREQKALIYVVCREKSTDFYIYMGGMFLSDSRSFGEITYRIDKNKAKNISMTGSTNNEALGLWQGSGVKFIKEIMTGKSLLLQVTPFNESFITVEFNIAGMADAIKPLRQACDW